MKKDSFSDFYQDMSDWLTDVKKHEVTQLVELVEQAKSIILAMEELPESRVKQFVANFKYDLQEFYAQNQKEVKHSIYLSLMKESFWAIMANITDKSQVEWAEIPDDFQHNGVYSTGDVIGFGMLECQQCHKATAVTHMTVVEKCIYCGHDRFIRESLTP